MKPNFLSTSAVMIQRVRVRFARQGPASQLTHLQQIDSLRRALEKSEWPVSRSQGKRPTMKISFGPAISVGYESTAEYCDVQLQSRLDLTKAKDGLSPHLPPGYEILEVKSIPRFFPSLEESINLAHFEMSSPLFVETRPLWDKFWADKNFFVTKKKSDREIVIDARSLVREWKLDGSRLEIYLRFGPGKTLKPEKIVQAVCQLTDEQCEMGKPTTAIAVKRTQFYLEKNNGDLMSL